jgi:hypothetical protein
MQDFAFGPTSVTVADGGTVTFANVGVAPHTATADDGTFDTALVAAGASASITVGGPGSYPFVCTFHPEMRGTIEVVARTAAASLAPDPSPTTNPDASPTTAPSPAGEGGATGGATDAGTPTGGGTTTGGGTASGATVSSPTAALEGLVGLIVGVTLVSIAAALFAKTIGGTVRRPG